MIVSAGEVGHSIIVAPQDLASFVKADFEDIFGGQQVMKLYFVRHGRTVWNQEDAFKVLVEILPYFLNPLTSSKNLASISRRSF